MKLQTTKLKGIFKASALLIAASVMAVSCNEKHAEYPPVTETPGAATYEINGYVMKSGTTTALSDVTVTYETDSKSGTTTTNSNGYFEFKGLSEYGTYDLTFEKDGYSTNYQTISFTQGSDGENKIQSVNVNLSALPENSTTIDPEEGGEVPIEGDVSGELVIPAGTVVRNSSGQTVTGPIGFYANEVDDISTSDANSYAPIAVLDLLPNGYTFTPALTLRVDNPMNDYYFGDAVLQYYNSSSRTWQTQSQEVTYEDGQYVTTISHFSIYKIALGAAISTSTTEEDITVNNPVTDNSNSIESALVSSVTVQKLSGYIYETPISTVLSNAGITTDVSAITEQIQNVIQKYLGLTQNPSTSFTTTNTNMSVNHTVPGGYILTLTASQEIMQTTFTFNLANSSGTTNSIDVTVEHAGDVVTIGTTLTSGNDHGNGGGGSN
ncbi:MAG: carboxypeptidase regulatory-like domain-containing protein [Rikenellaceae bacterium]|nr:carboxypeptidase regulatory-like domain-containing protein [Rikenellaceae bacterium]